MEDRDPRFANSHYDRHVPLPVEAFEPEDPLVKGGGALGVDINLLYTLAFGLGAALAGLAGLMSGPLYVVEIGMGDGMLIKTFVVIVIGGIGSIRGAFVAAVIVGMVDTFGRVLPALAGLPTGLAEMAIYILMAAVLFWRPSGLFPARG